MIEQHISKNYKEENSKPTKTLGGKENANKWSRMDGYQNEVSIGAAASKLQKKVVDKVKKLQQKTKEADHYDDQIGNTNDI